MKNKNSAKILSAKLTISRISSNEPPFEYIRLYLGDGASHLTFATIDINFEEWGRAIAGLPNQDCEAEYRQDTRFGLYREYKEEKIILPDNMPTRLSELAGQTMDKLLLPLEIDGWKGQRDDFFNMNKHFVHDYQKFAKVGFVRYVERSADD